MQVSEWVFQSNCVAEIKPSHSRRKQGERGLRQITCRKARSGMLNTNPRTGEMKCGRDQLKGEGVQERKCKCRAQHGAAAGGIYIIRTKH